MKDVMITEVKSGNGKIAIFTYVGSQDPVQPLDDSVFLYSGGDRHCMEMVDVSMNNPWVRVIVSNLNDVMEGSVNFSDVLRDIKLRHILDDKL